MSDLYIASQEVISHDGSRRVLAVGRARGGSEFVQLSARFADLKATGTREAAQVETLRRDGYRAWDHREQDGAAS